MAALFNTILYQPLFNALIALYNYVPFADLGIAIILLTILIRVILYPLFYKSFENQLVMQKLQPLIKKIQHDHKNDREKQARALMDLYKQHKINPFSGFLLILVQLPILITLYRLFLGDFTPEAFENLYSFISAPETIDNSLLGLINLKERSIVVVGLAAAAQYVQGKLSFARTDKKDETAASKVGKQMVFIGPILTLLILTSLPSAVGIYWLTTSVFSIFQQIIITRKLDKNGPITGNNQKNS